MAKRPAQPRPAAAQVLRDSTARDFGGGWNVIDSDLNLSSKFAKVLTNMFRAPDASMQVRWGTRLFANLSTNFTATAVPVGVTYFGTKLVVVSSLGDVVLVDGAGTKTVVWTHGTTGNTWVGAPLATFSQAKDGLIICNGVDKPLLIKRDYTCAFLVDAASLSNLHTPVAQLVVGASRYVVMAGDPIYPSRLHISAKDTSGTFYGDPAPNDGTYVDLASYVPNTDSTIRSITMFRNNLVIGFQGGVLLCSLGVYDVAGNHTPQFTDFIPGFGSISHPAMQSFGDEALYIDLVGVPALTRTIYLGTMRPTRASQLIDPQIQSRLSTLSFGTIGQRVFAVYNQREGQYMLFVPNSDTVAGTTSTDCFVYTDIPALNIKAWSLFQGWNFACGCRSAGGRVFFVSYDNRLYVYGTVDDPIYADFVNDTNKNADGTGIGISFEWVFPWADFHKRMNIKKTRHVAFDTKGTGSFTAQYFVDNLYTDSNGAYTPLLSMDFIGGDSLGFGGAVNSTEQPFGSGRRAADERLWKWPAKFKIARMRITGTVKAPLKFIAVSLTYILGGIRR